MARQVAVAIGVSHVGDLRPLKVKAGTDAFATWATDQGFEVVVHDDADGTKQVLGSDVFDTIEKAVDASDVERLFVFFGGHGMERGVGDDYWLLSRAAKDGSEAVNVAKSYALARRCGIPHVALFADACRTPLTAAIDGLVGRAIFPLVRKPRVDVSIDAFYATLSGDPALEPNDALYGIFTGALLDALNGRVAEAVQPVANGKAGHAVLARPLKDWIDDEVPRRSQAQVGVVQTPDCLTTSLWEPDVIGWVTSPPVVPAPVESPSDGPRTTIGMVHDERRALADTLAREIAAEPGRSHFETSIGISVVGADEVSSAYTNGYPFESFEENGARHVRIPNGFPPAPALVDVSVGGRRFAVGTLVVPGYVTTVRIGPNGAEHVALAEVGDAESIRDTGVLAAAAAADRVGRRDWVDDPDVRAMVDRGNPAMAVLAAYAYDRLGRTDDVERVVDRCMDRHRFVPYDLVVLSRIDVPTLPRFPLMSRGWALADELPVGEEWFEYGRTRLAPVPWTTFTELSDEARRAYAKRR